ncbi:hypothetical protein [uncultured Muribaculum sp.]|uniref:hypothetical protein n=1 Tax=uncultured Muribaculum sp. TaxID=1918613 RepID=UPI00266E9B9C|nr:hypothetical protein [uncultured Muribaculum sp.]
MEPHRGSLFTTSLPHRGFATAGFYTCMASGQSHANPIYKPSAHIRRRPPRNAWPEAIHVHNPDVGERILREDSLGSTIPYLPIPRRGYICETTMARIYCCNQIHSQAPYPHPQAAPPERLAGGHICV